MAEVNFDELYHKGELTWQEGEFTVERGFQWTPPGCHNSCGMLYYMKAVESTLLELGVDSSKINYELFSK